jgi:hypothetical protein
VLLRVENARTTINIDAFVGLFPLSVDKVHENLCLAFMTLKLDGFHEYFNGGNPKHGTPEAHEFVNQVALNHGKWEDLIEVCESYLNLRVNLTEICYNTTTVL